MTARLCDIRFVQTLDGNRSLVATVQSPDGTVDRESFGEFRTFLAEMTSRFGQIKIDPFVAETWGV